MPPTAPSTPVRTFPRQPQNTGLASTGADTGWLLLFGALFVATGALLLLIERRRVFRR